MYFTVNREQVTILWGEVNMYQIGIVDDSQAFIDYMKSLFNEGAWKEEEVIFHEYCSGEELISQMEKQKKYDLMIMDIKLAGMDGHTAAQLFREQYPNAVLIFCSGVCMPTVEAFEAEPFRYLLKEYTKERMLKELQVVHEKVKKNKVVPYIIGKKDNKLFKIHPKNVEYIEIAKKGSKIHCFQKKIQECYTSPDKVSEFYGILNEFGFAYAHNSYIVNMDYVVMVRVDELELKSGTNLTISRSHSKEFRRLFANKMALKY